MALKLPSLDAALHQSRPNAKPPKRRTLKRRKDRAAAIVARDVRAICVERDGRCALDRGGASDFSRGDVLGLGCYLYDCAGPAEWAHMHGTAALANAESKPRTSAMIGGIR